MSKVVATLHYEGTDLRVGDPCFCVAGLNVDTPVDYNSIARPDVMLVKNRTTCQMICEQPAVTNGLANPPYEIQNGGWLGWLPLAHKTIHPTASECSQLGLCLYTMIEGYQSML